jgi:hypothetical protein
VRLTCLQHIATANSEHRNVEDAIQSLPSTPHSPVALTPGSTPPRIRPDSRPGTPISSLHVGEESAEPLSMPTPGTLGEDARRLLQKTGDTISKPLNALGRIFSEALDNAEDQLKYFPAAFSENNGRDPQNSSRPSEFVPQTPLGVGESGQQLGPYQPPIQTPYKPRVRRGTSPLNTQSEPTPTRQYMYSNQPLAVAPRVQSLIQSEGPSRTASPAPRFDVQGDIPGLQAQIDRAHEQATAAAKATLRQIFPTTDVEVVEWVLEANQNDLGRSIEALLEISGGS